MKERRDIELKKLIKTKDTDTIPIFKFKKYVCVPEFGGKTKSGGISFIITSDDYSKPIVFVNKKAKDRGKVAFVPIVIGNKIILSYTIRNRILGKLYCHKEFIISNILSDSIKLKVNNTYIGIGFPDYPEELKNSIYKKMNQTGTEIAYGKYFHTLKINDSWNMENIIIPDTYTNMSRNISDKDNFLKDELVKNWPSVIINRYDPVLNRIYYDLYKVDFKEKLIKEFIKGYIENIKTFQNDDKNQRMFSAKNKEIYEKIREKIQRNVKDTLIIVQTIR